MMKLGKAYSIFTQIGRDDVTNEEKGEAILLIADMPTQNGITKDDMLGVIKYLMPMAFDPKRAFCCENCQKMAYEPSSYCPACGAKMDLEVDNG